MGIFYNDKKVLVAKSLLNYLEEYHCHKISSDVREFNGYRGNVVTLSDVANEEGFNKDTLSEAANILFENKHIVYESKDLRIPELSRIYISEKGRQAVKSSFYLKILLKKWGKRIVAFIFVAVAIIGAIRYLLPSPPAKGK